MLTVENVQSNEGIMNLCAILFIGIVVVLAVIGLLTIFSGSFRLLLLDLSKKGARKGSGVADNSDDSAEESSVDDGEIVAVIAAAIAAAESENTGMKFRVVSFRRT